MADFKSVIFRQVREKPTKFQFVFAITLGEMYPDGLCIHIPFRALLHIVMAGSWSDLSRNIGKRSVFYLSDVFPLQLKAVKGVFFFAVTFSCILSDY